VEAVGGEGGDGGAVREGGEGVLREFVHEEEGGMVGPCPTEELGFLWEEAVEPVGGGEFLVGSGGEGGGGGAAPVVT